MVHALFHYRGRSDWNRKPRRVGFANRPSVPPSAAPSAKHRCQPFLGLADISAPAASYALVRLASALTRAQRAFVAAIIRFLPAALSFRRLRAAGAGVVVCAPLFDSAHLLLCPSAILARAAALNFRRLRLGVSGTAAGSGRPPSSICLSSAILVSICLFCDSKP